MHGLSTGLIRPLRRNALSRWAVRALPSPVMLRAKGICALVALTLYLTLIWVFASLERSRLLFAVLELEAIHVTEESLAKVNTSVAYAVLKLQQVYYSPDPPAGYEGLILDIEGIQAGLDGLKSKHPAFAGNIARLERDIEEMRLTPARGALVDLRTSLHDLVEELDGFTRAVRNRKDTLSQQYRRAYDAISLIGIVGGAIGLLVFGGLVTVFFTRLAWDIRKLEKRALEVVTGYRGEPLPVTRQDEIGILTQAVNRMQSVLRLHENQIEMSRQQRFHHDKMAAIGSLAAGIAHEINNPIAAIHGAAQHMCEVQQRDCTGRSCAECEPQLILEHSRRVAAITRQMSELSRPRSAEPGLVDINALVRSTCSLMRYDKRFCSIELRMDLDQELPAVCCAADHVTQVLMNLIINAADATEGIAGRKPVITVTTATAGHSMQLTVADNGTGMPPEVQARAFEESFTTKPLGRGTGLGLFICKSFIEQCAGRITLDSTPGDGTRVMVELPLENAEAG